MKQQTQHLFMTWNFPLYEPRTVPKCSRHASCTAWRSKGGIDTLSLSIRCLDLYVVWTYTLSWPIRCPDRYVVPIDTLSLSIRCLDLYVVLTYTLSRSIRCPYRYVVSTYTLSRPTRCLDLYVVSTYTLPLSIRCPYRYIVPIYTLFRSKRCPDRNNFPKRWRETTVLILVKCQQRADFSIKFVVKSNKYWRVRKRTVDPESHVLREKWDLKLGGCGFESTKRPESTTTNVIRIYIVKIYLCSLVVQQGIHYIGRNTCFGR